MFVKLGGWDDFVDEPELFGFFGPLSFFRS